MPDIHSPSVEPTGARRHLTLCPTNQDQDDEELAPPADLLEPEQERWLEYRDEQGASVAWYATSWPLEP